MDAIELLNQKGINKIEARNLIAEAIELEAFSLKDFESRVGELKEKQIATVLEAIEAVTGKKSAKPGAEYLKFAEGYILSENNSCKREASRIVGNMAADYPGELEGAVEALLKNTDRDTLIIDLASSPGGVDFEAARSLKIDAQRALSLPGKCAPKTAAEIIKQTVNLIIKEVNW